MNRSPIVGSVKSEWIESEFNVRKASVLGRTADEETQLEFYAEPCGKTSLLMHFRIASGRDRVTKLYRRFDTKCLKIMSNTFPAADRFADTYLSFYMESLKIRYDKKSAEKVN